MITLDAWVSALCLAVLLSLAFLPRTSGALAANPWMRGIGRGGERVVHRGYWVFFTLAVLVGIFVRCWRLDELPRGMYQDSAMVGVEAISLLRCGTDQFGTSFPVHFEAWQYGQMSAMLPYLTVPFFALFGVSELTLRLPMLVVSLLALPVVWDFARRMLGKDYALLMLWLVAICPWQITQSRWALDCNLMGHFLLFSLYLLFVGMRRKPFLYLGMACFGLTMYTYGLALYTVPVLLVLLCAYLLRHRRISGRQAAACALVYLLVAAPFLAVMFINFLGLETVHLGPLTLQRFPQTVRAGDILFFMEDPAAQVSENLLYGLATGVFQREGDTMHTYPASRTLYAFSVPVILAGMYLVWRHRRGAVMANRPLPREDRRTDGLSFVFFWFLAMVVCSILTNESNIQRSNAVFYPLLFFIGYGLWQILRRVKGFWPVVVLLYAVGFLTFFQGYFFDTTYQARTANQFKSDLYGALSQAGETECDRYVISTRATGGRTAELVTIMAHELDSEQLRGLRPVTGADGEQAWYADRYLYTDFSDYAWDPQSKDVYIVSIEEASDFPAEFFEITPYEGFALVIARTGTSGEVE